MSSLRLIVTRAADSRLGGGWVLQGTLTPISHPLALAPHAPGSNHQQGNRSIIYIPSTPQKKLQLIVKQRTNDSEMAACGRSAPKGFAGLITVVKASRGRPRPVRQPVNHARHGGRQRWPVSLLTGPRGGRNKLLTRLLSLCSSAGLHSRDVGLQGAVGGC